MTTDYKFYYFPVCNRGELIRYIFHYTKTPFRDIYVLSDEWPAMKQKTPMGQLPILEIDGNLKICQSLAIARHLARKFGIAGRSRLEAAKCDMYVESIDDLHKGYSKVYEAILDDDDEAKAYAWVDFRDDMLLPLLGRFDKILEKNKKYGGFLIARKGNATLTWADIALAEYGKRMEMIFEQGILDEFLNVKRLVNTFHNDPGISSYIESRRRMQF